MIGKRAVPIDGKVEIKPNPTEETMTQEDYDVVIVGSGTAGQTAAYDLMAGGLKVAVVESGDRPGGTCALRGCQPKKFYYEIAETVARGRHLLGKGIDAAPRGAWPQVRARKNAFTAKIPEGAIRGMKAAGIDFLRGRARYRDPETLTVNDRPIKARWHVLATGARPMPLPFDGSHHLATSDQFLDLEDLPGRLVFVGGGFISFEFAHFAARLGPGTAPVRILEAAPRPLGPFDAEMVSLLVAASEEEGIEVRGNVTIEAVAPRPEGGFTVTIAGAPPLEADLVVHGAGRMAAIDDLNLDAAGIAYTRRGVTVDAHLRTSQPRVFAIGDCAATVQLARVADAEAHTAASNILAELKGGTLSSLDYGAVPFLLFTYPQYAMIGKTEDALRESGTEYRKSSDSRLSWPTYRRVGLGHAAYKILVGSDQRILGAHFLSDNATGLANTIKDAMLAGLTVDQLHRRSIMTPYPSRESDLIYMLAPLLVDNG
jgi:glutathione reductase (NADPH)